MNMTKIPYSYLNRQFEHIDAYLEDIRALVRTGAFTLGQAVTDFEEKFKRITGLPYCVAVGSGTDALFLSLKMLGIGPGDEVITAPNTFVATVGAIVLTGARPVFVDNDETYTLDSNLLESAITKKTRAILPVHLTGKPADMPAIMEVAAKYGLLVVEDAAQAVLACIDGKHVGSWGETAGFSLHPLKNLNVWGDGGVIVTRSEERYEKLRLWRNHGLSSRDEVAFFGHNSRLDSLQAVVANRVIEDVEEVTDKRIENARRYDEAFADLAGLVTLPPRPAGVRQVFHTYVIQARNREALIRHLDKAGVRTKVHYPIPLHLQQAAADLGYKMGDFPVCERHCRTILTLPVHQYLTPAEIDYVAEQVRNYYLN